jgi:phospholipid-binding lipoprotein MlaA
VTIVQPRPVLLAVAVALSIVWGVAPAGSQTAEPVRTEAAGGPTLTPAESAADPAPTPTADPAAATPAPAAGAGPPGGLDPADFAGSFVSTTDSKGSGEPPAGQSLRSSFDPDEGELVEYDPWAPFNEKTFAFNHGLDSYVIKPAAKAYDKVVPNWVQRAFKNMFNNVGSFRRIVSTALQGRFNDMGQEVGRFVINTMFGLGGFVNAAPSFGVQEQTTADIGQTFGVWGAGPGPYLVLPFLPPFTLRDAFGFAFDTALDPLTWVAPIEAVVGVTGERTVNERSLNLELYENVEESVFDLYSAVRNAYLQQRHKAVREGLGRSLFGRRERLIITGPR